MKRRLVVAMILGCALLALNSPAATYMKQENHTGEMKMMGQTQPARTDTMETWMEDNRAAMLTPEGKVLYLADQKKMYMIDNGAKQYYEVPMAVIGEAMKGNSLEDRMAAAKEQMTPEQKAQMEEAMKQLENNPQAKAMAEKMMGDMFGDSESGESGISATVTATGESETIDGYDTKKYAVEFKTQMGGGTQEVWATPDLELDPAMYHMMQTTMMAQMDGFDEFIEELKKIEGVPVKSKATMKMMGAEIKTTTRLLEYKTEASAPAGMFDLPTDYQKVDMMQGGMGGH